MNPTLINCNWQVPTQEPCVADNQQMVFLQAERGADVEHTMRVRATHCISFHTVP